MNALNQSQEKVTELPRGAEYYPVGLSPYQLDPIDPYAKTTDIFALIKSLRQRSRRNTFLLVANPYSNILANSSEATPEEAQRKAHRLARADQILYEAIQDVLQEQGDRHERIPVQIMSEMIDEQKFSALMYRLTTLMQSNSMFAEAVYSCVPENFRPRAHRTKTFTELAALPGNHIRKMYQRMDYVLQQIAQVLLLKGRKLGHIRETSYNAVTIFAADLLGISTDGLSFEQLDPEGASGTIPYRTVAQGVDEIRTGIISAETGLGMLKESYLFREEERDTEYSAAQKHVATMGLLYKKMLARSKNTDLEPAIKFRYVREILLTLIHGTHPVYAFLCEEAGISEVLNGTISLEEFEQRTCLLPFTCDARKPNEALEEYFIRYVNALIHHHGPKTPDLGEKGIQAEMCDKIYELSGIKMLTGYEKRVYADGWYMRYVEFHQYLLMKQVPLYTSVSVDELQTARFNMLSIFFNLIRGTDLENVYRRYMGMPIHPGQLPPGDRTALKKLFESDLWGDNAREYFTNIGDSN